MNRVAAPGTHEPGYEEPRIEQVRLHSQVEENLKAIGSKGIKQFTMGECNILLAREGAGKNRERLWHLTISTPDRHPTWDEIKTARYRLLPLDRCFGMLLPPPEYYVNIPSQDHVFHLWEITDPREVWTTG